MNLITIIAAFNVIVYTVLVVIYHNKHKARKEVTPVNKPVWKPCGYYTAKYERIKQHNDSIVKGANND